MATLLILFLLAGGAANAADRSTRSGGVVAGGTVGAVIAWGSGMLIPVLGIAIPGLMVGTAIGSAFGYLLSDKD